MLLGKFFDRKKICEKVHLSAGPPGEGGSRMYQAMEPWRAPAAGATDGGGEAGNR